MKTLKIVITLTFFSVLIWIILKAMQPNMQPTTPAPTVKNTPQCEIETITITVPAGYTVKDAMQYGKIIQIVW